MAANNTGPPLPNPFTPLAFLPPTLAQHYQISSYIAISTTAAYIWDWLMSFPAEITVIRQGRLAVPIFAYFLSRIGTLGSCIASTVFLAVPVASCEGAGYAIGACVILTLSSTSALFFFRVKAVYSNNKIITAFFGFLLLSLFGTSFLIPLAPRVQTIGTTHRCIVVGMARYGFIAALLNFVLDTLVFIAISVRIVSYSVEGDTSRARTRSFMKGYGLPNLSKSLLQGGQLYYSVRVVMGIVVVTMGFSPPPTSYHTLFIVPSIALESAMACRVFRGIKLGTISDVDEDTTKTHILQFRHRSYMSPSALASNSLPGSKNSRRGTIAVEVVKMTESDAQSEGKPDCLQGCHDGHRWKDDLSEIVFDRV